MIIEAMVLAQLAGGARVQPASPMRPAPVQSPTQTAKRTGGTPPVEARRRRRKSIWRSFR